MKKEREFYINDGSGSMYNDLYIPQEAIDEILEASNMFLMNQRNDKIDKLLDEDK